jgi:CelD/BcsL family acetyltransferase involved in cellulose biosynthesis
VSARIVPGRALAEDQMQRWSELQLSQESVASPFFRPEFTHAVAMVRPDVYVAVLERPDRVVGFLPYQRKRLGIGRPVGGLLSDYHGAVAEPELEWDPASVVRACGLKAWDFNHLVTSQPAFACFHDGYSASPYLDLSHGFEAYRRCRSAARSREIPNIQRKARKCEREVGTLRFTAHNTDLQLLHQVLRWKSTQYRQTGVPDIFTSRWTGELLERILATDSENFAGMLSTLHAGEHLVAAHMGMRSRDVWHWWFPAYDPRFARWSPGLILLLEMARCADGLGLRLIDLGKGDESYKARLTSDAVPLAEGSVTVSRVVGGARRLYRELKGGVRRTPLAGPAEAVQRSLRHRRRIT